MTHFFILFSPTPYNLHRLWLGRIFPTDDSTLYCVASEKYVAVESFHTIFHNLPSSVLSVFSFVKGRSKQTSKSHSLFRFCTTAFLPRLTDYHYTTNEKRPMSQFLASKVSGTSYLSYTFSAPLCRSFFFHIWRAKICYDHFLSSSDVSCAWKCCCFYLNSSL